MAFPVTSLWLRRVTPGEVDLRAHGLEGLAKNGRFSVFCKSFEAVSAKVQFHNGGATGLHNVVFPVVSTWNPTWNPLCVPGALGPGGPPTVVK